MPQHVMPYSYDWTEVDWAASDAAISRSLGCSREWVRRRRRSLGLPPSQGRRGRKPAPRADAPAPPTPTPRPSADPERAVRLRRSVRDSRRG